MLDSHCHLTDPRLLDQLEDVLARAAAAGVTRMITVGTDLADDRDVIALCHGRPNLRCAIGIHPNYTHEAQLADVAVLRDLQASPAVVALGEMGLDYHYTFSPREHQRQMFEAQLQLASEVSRPVIVHCRQAVDDALAVLRNHSAIPAVFHCFTGTPAEADRILAAGYFISFTGVITFKKNDEIRQVVRRTPLDRLLIETDAPYLSPEPMRKQKINEPALIVHTAAVMAQIKNVDIEAIDSATTANAQRFFCWPE